MAGPGLPATDKSGWEQSDYAEFLRKVGEGHIDEQVSLEFTPVASSAELVPRG